MQRVSAPRRTRKSRHPHRPGISPYLLDEIAFTRSDIEQARGTRDAVTH